MRSTSDLVEPRPRALRRLVDIVRWVVMHRDGVIFVGVLLIIYANVFPGQIVDGPNGADIRESNLYLVGYKIAVDPTRSITAPRPFYVHSVLFIYVWRLLDYVLPDLSGIFVFNNVLYWVGLRLLLISWWPRRGGNFLVLLGVGGFPPVFAAVLSVQDDTSAAVAVLMLWALWSYYTRVNADRRLLLGMALAGLVAIGFKVTMIIPVVVVGTLIAWTALRQHGVCRYLVAKSSAVAVAFALSAIVSVGILNRTYPPFRSPAFTLYLWDIESISVAAGVNYLDRLFNLDSCKVQGIEDVTKRYRPTASNWFYYLTRGLCIDPLKMPPARVEMARLWPIYAEHWKEYLWYRARLTFGHLPFSSYKAYALPEKPTLVSAHLRSFLNWLSDTFLFRQATYLVAVLIFGAVALYYRRALERDELTAVVAMTAVVPLFLVLLFFIAPAQDFRYLLVVTMLPQIELIIGGRVLARRLVGHERTAP